MSNHPEDALRLPLAIDEITPAWLTAALGVRRPGVEVTGTEVDRVVHGSATKIRLRLTYAPGRDAGLPSTMWCKGGFEGDLARQSPAYAREVFVYREVLPALSIDPPDSYFAGVDPGSGQAIVLLEDLLERGVTFATATVPLRPEVVAAALDTQAAYHAVWWGRPELEAIRAPVDVLGEAMASYMSAEHWDHCLALPRAVGVPDELRDRERVIAAALAVWEADVGEAECLLHGDPHVDNLYIEPDGSACFLDWQTAKPGRWVHDVAYFMVGALGVADRRAHERDLLAHYLDRLAGRGVTAPTVDEAWAAYRRQLVYGLMWVVCPEGAQPEAVIGAQASRFAAALVDHGGLPDGA